MNNPIVWVLVAIGAAIVAGFLFFMGASPPATGPAPESLIPDSIEGFIIVVKEARIEPVFAGEAYSSHAFYTPAPGSPWSGKIERLGITIFQFKDPAKISEARELLLSGSKTESIQIEGRAAELASEADGIGLFWQDRSLFIAIFVSAASAGEETQTLKEAALVAAKAVLATTPHSTLKAR